jgi:hypothetical protein
LDTQKPSANDSQWKIRALATVAIFGLTSLLLLQWDRGTPEEKEVAFSTARPPAAAPAPAPAAVPPMPPATTMAEAPTAATPVDKSDAAAKAAPPSAKLAAPKVAPPPARPSASPQPFPAEADTQRPSGMAPSLPTRDAATTAEPAMAGATALPVPVPPAAPSVGAPPAPVPAAPSMAPPAPAPAPAMRAAPTAKAQSYGAAQSARREDAPEATGRLKKAEPADDTSAMADASAAPTGRAVSPNFALFAAIRSADTAAVQQALASGADKNAKSNGTPAITLCVQSGKLHLVQLLAGAGADVNTPDAQGITPLAHARARGFDAIANALVSLGAN